jgi:hypothetical protein
MPARHWPSVGRIVDEFIMVETGVWSSQSKPWSREGMRASAKQSRLASRTRPGRQSVSQFASLLGVQNVGKGHGCTPMGRVQAVSECVPSKVAHLIRLVEPAAAAAACLGKAFCQGRRACFQLQLPLPFVGCVAGAGAKGGGGTGRTGTGHGR